MSFFKKVGRAVGGVLGFRSGRSAQDRQFMEDSARQQQLMVADFEAQRANLEGQQRIQGFWDQATDEMTRNLQQEERDSETKVEFGAEQQKRKFFT